MSDTLTRNDITRGYDDERWLGWGYLGGRRHMPNDGVRLHADTVVLDQANARGWDYERLFLWLNSRPGRWFADDPFYSGAVRCFDVDLEDEDESYGEDAR